jgi:CheY-like chemotaxis protein
VAGVVRQAGGDVSVESRVGEGAKFRLRFPATEAVAPPLVNPEPSSTDDQKNVGHVLLLDDESMIVSFMKTVIREGGYRVTAFTDSLAAYEAVKANPNLFDIVLADITMPKMTGDILVRRIRKIRPDIPIILMTGYTNRISENDTHRMGVSALLLKPVRKKRLLQVVREVLRKHHGGEID